MTPSEGAKSSGYRKIQGDDAQAIYDGRRPPKGLVSTIGPPIQIFHPIFDDFMHLVHDPNLQPTVDDLKIVQELMYFASEVGRMEDRHNGHNEGLRKRLRHILEVEVHEEPNLNGTKPDGVVTLQIGDARIAFLILELKRELGEGGCDPTTQGGLSMKRSWIDPTVSHNRSHLPSSFLDLIPRIEKSCSREMLLPNVLSRGRWPMVKCSGWHIHGQVHCPTPDRHEVDGTFLNRGRFPSLSQCQSTRFSPKIPCEAPEFLPGS